MNVVMVATPSYKNEVSTWYIKAALEYSTASNFAVMFNFEIGDSLVTRARNTLFAKYVSIYKEQNLSHLLYIDDDIYFPADSILNFLRYDLDVVGAAVPLKSSDNSRGVECAVVGVYEEVDHLLYKTKYVGTGVMMLSNKVVETLVKYCEENDRIYYRNGLKHYDIFRVGCSKGIYKSEDWFLCDTLRELGFDIHVDSNNICVHSDKTDHYLRDSVHIDPRALSGLPRDPLPEDRRSVHWTPNDWAVDTTKL